MMGGEPDNPEIKLAWKKSKEYSRDVINSREPGVHINNSQPRGGKTYGVAEEISKIINRRLAFFTANHDHLKDFKEDLEKFGIYEGEYIHGKGFERSCLRYPPKNKKQEDWSKDEKLVRKIYKGLGVKSSRFLCGSCPFGKRCGYFEYTRNAKDYRITLQPLEFLFTDYNDDKDILVVDETINKIETLYWDFNLDKLNQFIFNIEEFTKEDCIIRKPHVEALTDFHKTILRENSLIFTESPDTLFNIDGRTFGGRNGFLQNGIYITHPGKFCLDDFTETYVDIFYDFLDRKRLERIIKHTDGQIRKIIGKRDSFEIDSLIDSYIPLWHCLQIFEILVCKSSKEVTFLMSEKLTKKPTETLYSLEKVKTEGDYEYGFTTKLCPYVRNIKTGEYIISEMGKVYENTEKFLESRHDAWFTIGRHYLYQIFNKAEERTVLFLDATYNDMIFKKLYESWRRSYRIKKAIIERQNHPIIHGKVVPDRIKRPTITNKNSILYVVDSEGNSNYPKSSLIEKGKATNTLKKVVASIITIIEENPGKKVDCISHSEIEEMLIPILGLGRKHHLHYYNLRGSKLKSKTSACIGTPYIPPIELLYDYILMFNEFPKSTTPIRTDKKFEGYRDKELNLFFKSRVYDEEYQALHRNAPLQYNRTNLLFGKVPKRIEKELTIKHVKLEDLCNWYIYKTMDKFIGNESTAQEKIDKAIYRWKIFNKEYRPRHFLDMLEEKGLVTKEVERTRTNKKLVVYFTKKARNLYRKYRKVYGDSL